MIPDFDRRGFLPEGVHRCTAEEFLAKFMVTDARKKFSNPISNIINFAFEQRAESILIGGSFITDKEAPNDLDCVILFRVDQQIPAVRDGLDVDAKRIDIFFASNDHPEIVRNFRKLFSTSRFQEPVGVIEIVLRDDNGVYWDTTWEPDADTFEIVKRVYLGRHYVDTIKREKVLVTVHGIRSHSEWDADVTLVASANGWVVAPFRYGYVQPTVFTSASYRQELVDKFRAFLADVTMLTDVKSVSILAHSFGTYLSMSYALGFDHPPVLFDTMILAGSILSQDLDFSSLNGKVGYVVNEIAPNDEWAEWARIANFGRDPLFGNSATNGFNYVGDRLSQYRSQIFKHNNAIARDVMISRWLPSMEANVGSAYRDAMQAMLSRTRNPD